VSVVVVRLTLFLHQPRSALLEALHSELWLCRVFAVRAVLLALI
jgi:hypothetical protein